MRGAYTPYHRRRIPQLVASPTLQRQHKVLSVCMVGTIGAYHNRNCSVLPMLPRTVRPQFFVHKKHDGSSYAKRRSLEDVISNDTLCQSAGIGSIVWSYLKLHNLLWRRMGVAWIPVAQNGSQTATHTYATDNRNYMGTMARTRNSSGAQLWY